MKYNYGVPVSSYTRASQYTPTYHTPTYYTPSLYKPSQYTSTYATAAKYAPAQYSATHYTPSHYTPASASTYKTASTYRAASTYVPSYTKPSRYACATRRTPAQEAPAPVIPVMPPRRTVHFPNDIVFQDIVRRGDIEQIGRFMRARKVRVDALFHSGEWSLAWSFGASSASSARLHERRAMVCALSVAGMAALHEAVLTGNLEVVKLLVKYGADVHQRDEDGWTPLHMACSDGYPEIAK